MKKIRGEVRETEMRKIVKVESSAENEAGGTTLCNWKIQRKQLGMRNPTEA
jgi:hypothetical protein